MEENTSTIAAKFKKDTFPWIFWQTQLKAAKLKNSRWHPLMIRYCCLIGSFQFEVVHLLASSLWEGVRESGYHQRGRCVIILTTTILKLDFLQLLI